MKAKLHAFLNLELDEGEWSTSHSGYFISREINPSTHY